MTRAAAEIAPTSPFADWPEGLEQEMADNEFYPCHGTVLVSETDRV